MAKKRNAALRPKQEVRRRKKVQDGKTWAVKLLEILKENQTNAD